MSIVLTLEATPSLDRRGDDAYLGKTLALGMGHSGGFGLLRDREGTDSYSAIRSSVGAGVLVGLGVLEDGSGELRTVRGGDCFLSEP